MKNLPDITQGQLKTYEAVQCIRMAWAALIVVLTLFIIAFAIFCYAAFFVEGRETVKAFIGGVDILLGGALAIILRHLFPKRKPT